MSSSTRRNLGMLLELMRTLTDDLHDITISKIGKINMLNLALDNVSSIIYDHYKKFYKTTTEIELEVGKSEYDLPDNCIQPHMCKFSNATPIHMGEKEKFNLNNSGRPVFFDLEGTKIIFSPVPITSEIVYLTYHRVPGKMTEMTDYPDLPIGCEDTIVYYACMTNAAKTNESLQRYSILYNDALSKMKRKFSSSGQSYQAQRIKRVRYGPGSYWMRT
jgi:hypothetical protein